MTEYWVSQAKYYCKICNTWIADNKASRSFHEKSNTHKFKKEFADKKKQADKLHGARSEYDLQRQLKQIERAAQAALRGEVYEPTDEGFASSDTSHYRPMTSAFNQQGFGYGQQPQQSSLFPDRAPIHLSDNAMQAVNESLRTDRQTYINN